MTVPYLFAPQPGPIPLAELDANFAFATSGNTILTDTSGTPGVITVSLPNGQTPSYFAGLTLSILVANTIQAANPTISLNSLSPQILINANTGTIKQGQIGAANIITVLYDGTNFRLVSQTGSGGNSAYILCLPSSTPSIVSSIRIASPAIIRNSLGNYTVTHNLGATIYGVSATVVQSSGAVGVLSVFSPTSSQISFLALVAGSLSDAIGDVYLTFIY
jgi:hypothetical protein